MVTKEDLLWAYEERPQEWFEYYLNNYVRDYNLVALCTGRKPTTFFKALKAVMNNVEVDKYHYTELLKERLGDDMNS